VSRQATLPLSSAWVSKQCHSLLSATHRTRSAFPPSAERYRRRRPPPQASHPDHRSSCPLEPHQAGIHPQVVFRAGSHRREVHSVRSIHRRESSVAGQLRWLSGPADTTTRSTLTLASSPTRQLPPFATPPTPHRRAPAADSYYSGAAASVSPSPPRYPKRTPHLIRLL
jgi:hypothetical protein